MAIVFPTDPTVNQQFIADGKTWYWDGEKWVALSSPSTSAEQLSPILLPGM
jgi:hypothetical protein